MSKEFPIHEKIKEKYREKYKNFPHGASHIAVFGSSLKKIFHEAGVADEDNIFVTGPPRLDAWRKNKKYNKQEIITLLSFRDGYGSDVEEEFVSLISGLLEKFKGNCGKLRLYIKAKNKNDNEVICSFVKEKMGQLPDNVNVLYEEPLHEILPKSKAIIGYNSLSVIEGLLTDVPIIIPYWVNKEKSEDMLGGLKKYCRELSTLLKGLRILIM